MDHSVSDLTKVNRKAAQPVYDRAREIVPRRSGRLARSIKVRATARTAHVQAGKTGLVPYAGPIHFGWRRRNIEPQPFLYGALDDRRQEVADVYANYVGDLVERLDRETPG
jgi:hypothetical protein